MSRYEKKNRRGNRNKKKAEERVDGGVAQQREVSKTEPSTPDQVNEGGAAASNKASEIRYGEIEIGGTKFVKCQSDLVKKDVVVRFEKDYLFLLKKKSLKFPTAKFFCRLCDYHCFDSDHCERHMKDTRHQRLKKMRVLEVLLRSLPPPEPLHIAAITTLIDEVYDDQALTDTDLIYREEVVKDVEKLIKDIDPDVIKLVMYGSSHSTLGIASSDVNMDFATDVPPSHLKDAHLELKENQDSENPYVKDVQSDFSAKVPCVRFIVPSVGVRCVLGINNTGSHQTSSLLYTYSRIDPRLRKLAVAFRYLARLSQIDNQAEGTLPAHVYTLMTVFFLQQSKPPVLPVLHEINKPKSRKPEMENWYFKDLEKLCEHWKCENKCSVGELWVQMLRFYSMDFDINSHVISIRQFKLLSRQEKKWASKKLAIEDPFMRRWNVARSVSHSQVFEYISDRLRAAYLYYGVPQTKTGAAFKDLRSMKQWVKGRKVTGPNVTEVVKEDIPQCDEDEDILSSDSENGEDSATNNIASDGELYSMADSEAKPNGQGATPVESTKDKKVDSSAGLGLGLDDYVRGMIENSLKDAVNQMEGCVVNLRTALGEINYDDCNISGDDMDDDFAVPSENVASDTHSNPPLDLSQLCDSSGLLAELGAILDEKNDSSVGDDKYVKHSVEGEAKGCISGSARSSDQSIVSNGTDTEKISNSEQERRSPEHETDDSSTGAGSKRVPESLNELVFKFDEEHLSDSKGPAVMCSICQQEGHLKSVCPEENLPPPPPLPPLTKRYKSQLDQLLGNVPKDFEPSSLELEMRQTVVYELEAAIRESYPDARLQLFGSSCNGFGFRGSDLDLCLTFDDEDPESLDSVMVIEQLAKVLKRMKSLYNVFPITTAKVPIVKFRHRRSQLEGDISLYNTLAIQNTKMLQMYSEIDTRVKYLGYTMKVFAKICDICDASRGSLSSYAYILLVIYFLQQRKPPVIPVLQELCPKKGKKGKTIIDGWNAWFFDDLSKVTQVWPHFGKNKETVAELWIGLLRFYTEEFNMKDYVVSIRQKTPLTKFEKLWNNRRVAIEDPFDLNHNLGGGLSRKMNMFIVSTFRNGRKVFGTSLNTGIPNGYKSLQDYLFDPSILTDSLPPSDRNCHRCGKIGHYVKECPMAEGNRDRQNSQHPDQHTPKQGRKGQGQGDPRSRASPEKRSTPQAIPPLMGQHLHQRHLSSPPNFSPQASREYHRSRSTPDTTQLFMQGNPSTPPGNRQQNPFSAQSQPRRTLLPDPPQFQQPYQANSDVMNAAGLAILSMINQGGSPRQQGFSPQQQSFLKQGSPQQQNFMNHGGGSPQQPKFVQGGSQQLTNNQQNNQYAGHSSNQQFKFNFNTNQSPSFSQQQGQRSAPRPIPMHPLNQRMSQQSGRSPRDHGRQLDEEWPSPSRQDQWGHNKIQDYF